MNVTAAVQGMGALAHPHRMEIFRALVRVGPSGRPAGWIADRLAISPSALSFHIAQLERAGLVHVRRQGRHLIYAVDIDGMRALLTFLTEDCCDGHPEICSGIAVGARPARVPEPTVR